MNINIEVHILSLRTLLGEEVVSCYGFWLKPGASAGWDATSSVSFALRSVSVAHFGMEKCVDLFLSCLIEMAAFLWSGDIYCTLQEWQGC